MGLRSTWLTAAALAGLCSGCASVVAQRATHSAGEELKQQVHEVPEEDQGVVAERAAAGAVRGALSELSKPERQDELSRAIESALIHALNSIAYGRAEREGGVGGSGNGGDASRALAGPLAAIGRQISDGIVNGITARLESELGRDGKGPFAETLAHTTEQVGASAMLGVRKELNLVAGCEDPNSFECLELRAHDLGEAAARGAVKGLGGWLLLGVFLLGVVASSALRELVKALQATAQWWHHRRAR